MRYLLLILLLATLALAGDGEGPFTEFRGRAESYWRDNQTALRYLEEDGTDSIADVSTTVSTYLVALTSDNTTSTSPNRVGARQNIPISGRFSNAGATATIYIVYYNQTTSGTFFILGVETPQTLTAGSAQDGDGLYIAPTFVADSYGATHCAVLVTSVSAGTVSLGVGSF